MSDFAYSQISPDDGATPVNTVAAIVRTMIAVMNVMKLVKVTAFNAGTGSPPTNGTVNVQLLVSQVDGQGYAVKHGIVNNLPVWRLQGGPWGIVCDPKVDEYGYIVCADRDSSLVVKNPGIQNPGSARKYNVADGIYIGGCLNAVPTSWIWLKSDGTVQISDSKGNVLTTSSAGWNFAGNVTFQNNVVVDGSLNVTGDTVSDGVDLKTHTHGGVTTGSGDTGPPL